MFYVLRSSLLNKHCYAWENYSFIDWKRTVCEKCGRTVSTAQMEEGCLKLELDGGSYHPDLLQFTGAGPRLFLLSKRALDAFIENGNIGNTVKFPVFKDILRFPQTLLQDILLR